MGRTTDVDFLFSDDGDFVITSGDLGDTSSRTGLSILQEVRDRLTYPLGAWITSPEVGHVLDTYFGERLTERLETLVALEVERALTHDQLLYSEDFEVLLLRLNDRQVMVRVVILGFGEEAQFTLDSSFGGL